MRLVLPIAAILLAAACDVPPPGVPIDPSYTSDIQPIFNAHCISCHGNSGPSASYSLTTRTGALDNGSDSLPNVVAGSADSSKLCQRIAGIETPQMPLGQSPLDSIKQGTIENWVDKGAKNN